MRAAAAGKSGRGERCRSSPGTAAIHVVPRTKRETIVVPRNPATLKNVGSKIHGEAMLPEWRAEGVQSRSAGRKANN